MAKGARASTVKRNNAKLRANVFGPVVDARTARLSAKLQELIAKPGPNDDRAMDLGDDTVEQNNLTESKAKVDAAMDIDTKSTSTSHKVSSKRKSTGVEKKTIRRKPRNLVVFPTSIGKRKRITQSKKKSV